MTESPNFVTSPVRVVETHISVLLFFGDKVYKIHKPVHFDFLDFRDRGAAPRTVAERLSSTAGWHPTCTSGWPTS